MGVPVGDLEASHRRDRASRGWAQDGGCYLGSVERSEDGYTALVIRCCRRKESLLLAVYARSKPHCRSRWNQERFAGTCTGWDWCLSGRVRKVLAFLQSITYKLAPSFILEPESRRSSQRSQSKKARLRAVTQSQNQEEKKKPIREAENSNSTL